MRLKEWDVSNVIQVEGNLSVRPTSDRQRSPARGDTNVSVLLLIKAELDNGVEICSDDGLPDAGPGGLSIQPQAAPRTTGFFLWSLYPYVPHHTWRSRREWVQVTLEHHTGVRGLDPLQDEKSEYNFTVGPPCPQFHIRRFNQAWMMRYGSIHKWTCTVQTCVVQGPTVPCTGRLVHLLPEKEENEGLEQGQEFWRKIPPHGNHKNGDYCHR